MFCLMLGTSQALVGVREGGRDEGCVYVLCVCVCVCFGKCGWG